MLNQNFIGKKSAESLVICQTFSNFAANSINQPTIMNTIKDNIKRLGWTQVQLAEKLGTTKQSLNNTLSNDGIALSKVRQIADIIGCSIIDLLQDGTNKSSELICPHCGKPISIETKISTQ